MNECEPLGDENEVEPEIEAENTTLLKKFLVSKEHMI